MALTGPNAAEQLTSLSAQVQGVGTGNSLTAKVSAAQQALARGNVTAACGQLGAFLNAVAAQRGGSISAVTADLLLAAAT